MTRSERWKTFACFMLVTLAALSGSATEIRLKQRVESRGSVVLLGDIAELREDPDHLRSANGHGGHDVAALARIELFPAPGVSRSRTIRRREVRELLGLHGVQLQRVRFTGAEAVLVQTSTQPRLRNVAPTAHTAPAGAPATASPLFSAAKPIQSAVKEAPATELVLAPVRGLRRGEVIRASNVTLIPVPVSGKGSVTKLGIQPVLHTDEVLGMAATRPVAANQPLDLRMLERPIVVRKGELVTVTSKAPGVRVETVARAIDNAALGDLVVLESIVNRKDPASVTGRKTAEVYASGIRVSSPPERPTQQSDVSPSERKGAE